MALILAMDDDPGLRDLLEETLGRVGHKVIAAANGRDLLVCAAHPPALPTAAQKSSMHGFLTPASLASGFCFAMAARRVFKA